MKEKCWNICGCRMLINCKFLFSVASQQDVMVMTLQGTSAPGTQLFLVGLLHMLQALEEFVFRKNGRAEAAATPP
jgi:hypothetical protein